MTAGDVIEGFADLFEGRRDAYGLESGGAQRVLDNAVWSGPLGVWQGHLNGERDPIGVYPCVHVPLSPESTSLGPHGLCVKWGCVDFDVRREDKPAGDYDTEGEAHVAAVNLQRVLLLAYNIKSWVEVTKSRGRHVWVFAEDWVPAATMRRALLVASEVAGTPTREINPKQEDLPDGALGNYVRLPYPGGLRDPDDQQHTKPRTVFFPGCASVMGVFVFVHEALEARVQPSALADVARHYVPPPPPVALGEHDAPECDKSLTRKLSPLAWTVFNDGPLPGSDRSSTLYKLAALCKDSGLPPDEGLAVVTAADESWGKFSKRADGARRLQEIVGSAYRGWEA